MSALVGQHQQTTLTNPQDGQTNSAAYVVANDNAVAGKHNDHDADPGLHVQSSTLAGRPAFGTTPRFWYTTDTKQVWFDTGAAWVEIGYLSVTGGTIAGNLAVTGSTITLGDGSLPTHVIVNGGSNSWIEFQVAGALVGQVFSNPTGSGMLFRYGTSAGAVSFSWQDATGAVEYMRLLSTGLTIAGGLTIAAASLIGTTVSFTNGAGAQAGTLTNAPSAGNPTKWIPVNDNGTTRYLPAW